MSRTTHLVWLLASATMTLAGPFGTFIRLPIETRAVFWFGMIGLAMALSVFLRAAVRTLLPGRGDWAQTTVFAPLFALTFTPILYAVVEWLSRGANTMTAFDMTLVVVLTPFFVTAMARILGRQTPGAAKPRQGSDPRILQRLPLETGDRILRISVRDHYVEIVTDRTKEKVLMRFSDAISETEGIPGLQVHRSHWVAEDAVRAVEREGGRMFLALEDGSRVPVSRGFRNAVIEAGIGAAAA